MLILGLRNKSDRQNTILLHCRHGRAFGGVQVSARPVSSHGSFSSELGDQKCVFGGTVFVSAPKHKKHPPGLQARVAGCGVVGQGVRWLVGRHACHRTTVKALSASMLLGVACSSLLSSWLIG